jgi:hypothetical protein
MTIFHSRASARTHHVRCALALLALFLVPSAGAETVLPPARHVESQVLTSVREPAVKITIQQGLGHIGADRFSLHGNADCEFHVFADSGADGTVKRVLWIQFEGYLPEKPELHYDYESPKRVQLDGMDFIVDTFARRGNNPGPAGSDTEHLLNLLKAHGVAMADSMMYTRLVHLLDASNRRELMIIYGEALPVTGPSAADLAVGGKARDQWQPMADALTERAVNAIHISD